MTRTVVALDGPAGAGKSTVAALVAARLGLPHLDTGATYRLVALRALREGVALDDGPRLAELARRVAAACTLGPDGSLRFQGRPLGQEIRTPEVSAAASLVAAHPQVREVLVRLGRDLVPPTGAVVEGRDIGTVVWPDATLKVYLEAGERTRALRLARDLRAEEPDAVLRAVQDRDRRDRERPVGALRPAPDALVIDTEGRTPAEVAEAVLRALQERQAGPGGDPRPPNRLYRLVRWGWGVFLRRFLRLEVRGAERIPARGPAILAPNHRSLVDIPLLANLTPRMVRFMGKEELFRSRLGNRVFTALGGFPVRRGKPDRRALATALELLRAGELVAVYPEGTRTPRARFERIEDGFAYLALKTGAPVVPVAVTGTEAVLPPGARFPRRVTVRVLVGEPFTLGGPVEGIVTRSTVQAATERARARLAAVMEALESR